MSKHKFKYVGDPNDQFSGPQVINQFGQTWHKGEAADVEIDEKKDDDKTKLSKLQGHSHFVDMSDKDSVKDVSDRQKALEKQEEDAAKAAESQRKRDEADEKQRERNMQRSIGADPSGDDPGLRPPGKVTREAGHEPFGGRTVEERTPAEDHTKAGKTKS